MDTGMGGFPGPSDRSREKQLAHDHRYRAGGPASERLEIGPPSTPAPETKPFAPLRLWSWLVRRWNGE
jgi:hypothetical protein